MNTENKETIMKIIDRAVVKNLLMFDRLSLKMDLDTAIKEFNLKVDELLAADDFNFAHDIVGIQNHIDRSTKTFINHFLPRYANTQVQYQDS